MTEQANVESKLQRSILGTVVSNKMNKTIVVQVERKVKHALYGKYVRKFTKLKAHDENNACNTGDLVLIEQTRPLSKSKCWKLVEVKKKAQE